jgi:hypothetical protein
MLTMRYAHHRERLTRVEQACRSLGIHSRFRLERSRHVTRSAEKGSLIELGIERAGVQIAGEANPRHRRRGQFGTGLTGVQSATAKQATNAIAASAAAAAFASHSNFASGSVAWMLEAYP